MKMQDLIPVRGKGNWFPLIDLSLVQFWTLSGGLLRKFSSRKFYFITILKGKISGRKPFLRIHVHDSFLEILAERCTDLYLTHDVLVKFIYRLFSLHVGIFFSVTFRRKINYY